MNHFISTEELLNDSVTRGIVLKFINNLPVYIDRIVDDIKREDREDLQKAAHQLCGTAGNFGFNEISNIAALLNEKAIAMPVTEMHDELNKLYIYVSEASAYAKQIHSQKSK